IGADDVGTLDDVVGLGLVHAGDVDLERGLNPEAFAIRAVAEADFGGDLGVFGEGVAALAGGALHGAEEAGGIADGEKLLGIGAACAIAAHFLGRGQGDVEYAVIGGPMANAATGGGGAGGVHDLGHSTSPEK